MIYKLTEEQVKKTVERGAEILAEYCMNINLHYLVTGSSGGTDSAVTLGFAQRASALARAEGFNLTSVAMVLPCESDPEDTRKGMLAAQTFGAMIITVDLNEVFRYFKNLVFDFVNMELSEILPETGGYQAQNEWAWSKRVAQGNIKARLRMITLYHTARMLKGMVMSTDNLSEYFMAFWTICGDVGDFNVIQNILKGKELYEIAKYLGVPEEITRAKPGDGLKVGGSAEDQLGANYRTIDTIMIRLIQKGFNPNGSIRQLENLPYIENVDPALAQKIAERCLRGAYKRRGTVTVSREELGLPPLKTINLHKEDYD